MLKFDKFVNRITILYSNLYPTVESSPLLVGSMFVYECFYVKYIVNSYQSFVLGMSTSNDISYIVPLGASM